MPDEVVARARSFIGSRFRLQGRGPDGFDCVGLVAAAHDLRHGIPENYALRGFGQANAEALLDRYFSRRREEKARPGDVVLLMPDAVQLHLGIWTGASLIHAHASLRRVVETPGPITQPHAGYWHQEKD